MNIPYKIKIFSFVFIFLTGCSTSTKRQVIQSNVQDATSQESLWRYGNLRLEDYKKLIQSSKDTDNKKLTNILLECHQGQIDNKKLEELPSTVKKTFYYWHVVGVCSLLDNLPEKALFSFRYSISLAKSNLEKAMAFNNLSLIFMRQGNNQLAISNLIEANKLNNSSPVILFNLSSIYIESGLFNQALPFIKSLYTQNKKDPDVNILYAKLLLETGQNKDALSLLQSLESDQHSREEVGTMLARIFIEKGDYKNAKLALSKIDNFTIKKNKIQASTYSELIEKLEGDGKG